MTPPRTQWGQECDQCDEIGGPALFKYTTVLNLIFSTWPTQELAEYLHLKIVNLHESGTDLKSISKGLAIHLCIVKLNVTK